MLLVVIVVGASIGYSVYRLNQIRRVTSHAVIPVKGPTENILLIGSTNRCSATNIKLYRLQCQESGAELNSDVVLLAHLDPSTGKISILSIPRDTFVPDARRYGSIGCTAADNEFGCYNKIDAALADKPDQLVTAIEQDYGIPINHFVELNFDTFAAVVNAVGGLHMYFPDRLVDASSLLDVHNTGCIFFNGQEALELVRSRHLYWFTKGETPNTAAIQAATNNGTYYTAESGGHYDGSGDLGRILRVHLFLEALARAVKAKGFGNPLTDNALIGAIAPNLTVDSTFGDTELLHLAVDFSHVDVGKTPELTVPIINDAATFYYKGYNYGDVVFPAEPQDQHTIDEFLGSTPPGLKLSPSTISVSVVDGTNSPSATGDVAEALGALGYKVIATTATNYVGPVSESTVEYAPGHLQQAERVMSSLAGTVVLGIGRPAAGADVSIIAGSELAVARPAPTTSNSVPTTTVTSNKATTTSTAATTSTTTPPTTVSTTQAVSTPSTTVAPAKLPTPATSNPNIGAPTAASPPIPRYDPRSCPLHVK